MTEEVTTFTLNDKEYSFEDASDKAKYIIGHISDLRQEEADIKRNLDKVNVTLQAFTNLLQDELESAEEEYEVEEEEA
jgi:hypothetical protein